MSAESFSSAWKGSSSCGECSIRLNVFRKKKTCFFCKNPFCQACIIRREDKKFCCRKCQVLTARPLDRSKLLNLRSRDLVNYLSSKHIPTNGCVEKEDLVNVLIRAVNNSCFHASSSSCCESSSSRNFYPSSSTNVSNSVGQTSLSVPPRVDNLYNEDGIRITGHSSVECEGQRGDHSSHFEQNNVTQPSNTVDAVVVHHDSMSVSNSGAVTTSSVGPVEQIEVSTKCTISSEIFHVKKPLTLSDIKSKNDLEALSVKQLKELLMRNRTDFKGCIERTELVQKANRLWNDYTVSRKDLENLPTDELCKICMDAPIECVLLECGHMATCTSCGKQLCECPICRQFVVRCVRTFKA